jgi:hypothetical protein
MNRPLFKKADAVIIALLVILCGVVLLLPRQSGGEVKITENGKTAAVLPLDKDGELTVGAVTVTVSGGEAWISGSDCADKTCIRTGHLRRAGDAAVCLPNRVAVTVTGERETDGVTW